MTERTCGAPAVGREEQDTNRDHDRSPPSVLRAGRSESPFQPALRRPQAPGSRADQRRQQRPPQAVSRLIIRDQRRPARTESSVRCQARNFGNTARSPGRVASHGPQVSGSVMNAYATTANLDAGAGIFRGSPFSGVGDRKRWAQSPAAKPPETAPEGFTGIFMASTILG